ncbi:2-hydroxyacyl-CoA dehydratase family protein [Papillibacter cinnamivorans]|uniref:2-hydroxyglutaryl-CoA dehydratase, D-component n=1 Tax=Papillibacter cinnamivorans DSM 12816 TaxID=1122930 RepID=A0A1W2CC15_9FIRM|nr:2-hydroxyacyl-CoA dehydratase family protein [Papillibacter cinnamivorans]SMC82616.1 2-hydroxyglutaryl-CoA dehydratase, D-component [Papillibacter cinnamivorans DSM 12816]
MNAQGIAGLKYLEKEIATCERRIARIKGDPDPTKPKSNVLLYELERDFRIEQREAYLSGKPLGLLGLGPLTRAMGMVPWDAIMAADRTHGSEATRYFNIIRKGGMPEHTCDRCSVLIPMMSEGDFPRPSYLETSNFECIPVYLAHLIMAETMDVPHFHVDRPFKNYKGELDDASLKFVTDQLYQMIEDIEAKVPGCKYDEDYMIELQEYNRQYLQYFQQLWELKAAIPCPLSGRESFREVRLADMYPDPKKAVEYMRLYVEEVGDKVAKGVSAAQPEEKLRLLWSVAGPFYADPFSWLEQRGVAIPAAEMTIYNGWFSKREAIWGDPWKGRKLTPIEEEARQLDFTWGRLGQPWVDTHINSCKDLHLDGIIYFMQWGCPTSNNMGKVVADTAEKELGIPTLLVEGRMLESSIFDSKDFFSKLEDFIAVAEARKNDRSKQKNS